MLVVSGGSPIALGDAVDFADAILFTWYPGEAAGQALADLLFGDAVPSGKLPMTFPKGTDDLAPLSDYDMTGRTYRYSTAEPEFPFGFGLSYAEFTYSDLSLSETAVSKGDPLSLSITVSNVGGVAGDEVVQVYLSELEASVVVPQHKLVAFQRVTVPANELVTVNFALSAEDMSHVDDNGRLQLEPGSFRVTVGGCSPSVRGVAAGAPEPLTAQFEVVAA